MFGKERKGKFNEVSLHGVWTHKSQMDKCDRRQSILRALTIVIVTGARARVERLVRAVQL